MVNVHNSNQSSGEKTELDERAPEFCSSVGCKLLYSLGEILLALISHQSKKKVDLDNQSCRSFAALTAIILALISVICNKFIFYFHDHMKDVLYTSPLCHINIQTKQQVHSVEKGRFLIIYFCSSCHEIIKISLGDG